MAINKKLIHFNTFENFNSKKLSANIENTKYTLGVNGEIQKGSPDILYQSIVYIKDTKQQWTHGQLYTSDDNYFETKVESQNKLQEAKSYTDNKTDDIKSELVKKQDVLVSGTNIKTVNGQSLLGNGDLEIQEFKTYTFDYDIDGQEKPITQEELNKILEADKIYIKRGDRLIEVIIKNEFDNLLVLSGYFNNNKYVNEYHININKNDLTCLYTKSSITLVTKSELGDLTDVYYDEIVCPNIEDGLVLEEQYINFDPNKISILLVNVPSDESFKGFQLRSNILDSNYSNSTIIFYGKYTDTSLLKATYNAENQTLTFNIIEQNTSTQKTTQTIQLNQGWNWVSFYVETSLEKLQNALGTNGIEIKYMDFTTSYDEESGLWLSAGNPLTSIEPSKMYMINTNSDCVIELEGKLLEDVEITLNPGVNWIAYPLNVSMDVNMAFMHLEVTDGDDIKNDKRGFSGYLEGWGWDGNLSILEPGQGYVYTNNSSETKTFKYPTELDIKLLNYETKEDSISKLQEAKDYTDTAIANLVDSAPETLNTLNELATAIQENEDVVDALNQSIGSKQNIITDLETIRQGAAKGATALQEHQDISGKADVDGNPNGIVVRENDPQNPINIHPYGIIESESWKYNEVYSTEWVPYFLLSGNSLSLGSGISIDDGFKIEAVQNIRTQDRSDEEFLRTSHTVIQQWDERGSCKGTGLLLTDDFIQLYTYNPESETDTSENMTELELEAPFNDLIYDTRLRGIAEPISNHDAVNKKYVDDNYVSVNNIKTINGQSLLGEGDIVISSEGNGETDMSNYYTKEEIDNIIGNINTILESIING